MKIVKNIYDKAVASLRKHYVSYPNVNGKVYKVSKICFTIFNIFTSLMTVFFVISLYLTYSSSETNSVELLKEFAPNAIFFLGATVIFLSGIVLLAFKLDLVAFIVDFISGLAVVIALIPNMKNVHLSETGLHIDYWWRHFFPFFFCLVFLGILAVMRVWAKSVELRAYKNLLERIYAENKDAAEMSEDDFTAFLENYDPRAVEEERRRNKKNKGYKPVFSEQSDKNK